MNKYLSPFILACLTALASCSQEHEGAALSSGQDEMLKAIRITSDVGALTRTAPTPTQDAQLLAGEKVYVWAFFAEDNAAYDVVKAWGLQADGFGKFSYITTGDLRYYPNTNKNINLKAIHSSVDYENGTALPATMSHTVEALQTDADAIAKSDMLYAATTGGYGPESADFNGGRGTAGTGYYIPLQFSHLLSHVTVTLENDNLQGFTQEQVQSITIGGITRSCTYAPEGDATATGTQDQTVQMKLTHDAANNRCTAEAVLPPQVIAQGAKFITIVVKDANSDYTYEISYRPGDTVAEADRKLTAVTRYDYNLTCSLIEIRLTATITPWTPESLGTVETEL